MRRLGYLGTNTILFNQRPSIRLTRTVPHRYKKMRGALEKINECALKNVKDFLTVLDWNEANDIWFYGAPQGIFPHYMEMYKLEDLDRFSDICYYLELIGKRIISKDHRLSIPPGRFAFLGSDKPDSVNRAIQLIEGQSRIFELLGLDNDVYHYMCLNIGSLRGGKQVAMDRFCKNFEKLPGRARSHIVVENDDRVAYFTIQELYEGIYQRLGTPLVFNYHHHKLNPGELGLYDGLSLARQTWPLTSVPVAHYCEGPNDPINSTESRKHMDFIEQEILTFDFEIDIMVEAKAREQALLSYRRKFLS